MVGAPVYMGKAWATAPNGDFLLPRWSLAPALVNWAYRYLKTPGGKHAGEPFLPTMEQFRLLMWWFAVDETGAFVYRSMVIRRVKGWGKDPFIALLALLDLCAPSIFSHWDKNGQPVGKRQISPWVQLAAVSRDQTRNTMTLFSDMLTDELKKEHKLEVNRLSIYNGDGHFIEAVTSSPSAIEGKRVTLALCNEVQWWVAENQGDDMFTKVLGNFNKGAGNVRWVAICNGHIEGQGSVGEQLYNSAVAVQAGEEADTGMLYDSLEAPLDTPIRGFPDPRVDRARFDAMWHDLVEGVKIANGDATWLIAEKVAATFLNSTLQVSEAARMHLNRVGGGVDAFIIPSEWDPLAVDDWDIDQVERVTLGLDGSMSDDHSALVAVDVDTGVVFLVERWRPRDFPDNRIDKRLIDEAVRDCFKRWEVLAFRSDVHELESYVDAWERDFGWGLEDSVQSRRPIAYDMRGKKKAFALDVERFYAAVKDKKLKHNGDSTLAWYVYNAVRYVNSLGMLSVRKARRNSTKKIDALISAVLAYSAYLDWDRQYGESEWEGGIL